MRAGDLGRRSHKSSLALCSAAAAAGGQGGAPALPTACRVAPLAHAGSRRSLSHRSLRQSDGLFSSGQATFISLSGISTVPARFGTDRVLLGELGASIWRQALGSSDENICANTETNVPKGMFP